jgi:hypothetical protein
MSQNIERIRPKSYVFAIDSHQDNALVILKGTNNMWCK